MKCSIPEISWHNRDPVLSVDIQTDNFKSPSGEVVWRIVSGGADSHVLVWHLSVNDNGGVEVLCVADLERHQKSVNVVRFSPSGEIIASADDESIIILWKQRKASDLPVLLGEENKNHEHWMSWKVLRGHLEDIYDISWSPDSNFLVSGAVDNTAILWDINKGRNIAILDDYKGFVQGVAWDPCNQYVCTLSTDRICRLIDINTKKTVERVSRAIIPTKSGQSFDKKPVRLFHDDTFKSFFRRLTFTPDGSLIIAPSGIIESSDSTGSFLNATIVFSRNSLKEPIMILPSLDESTIAVRCCPLYFELRENGPTSVIPLPYRMVFAVATQRSVFIYDTQQISPLAVISNIHYTRLTDVAWSSDGMILIVSSTDGYCSIVQFQVGDLGKIYKRETLLIVNDLGNLDKVQLSTESGNLASSIEVDSKVENIEINSFYSSVNAQSTPEGKVEIENREDSAKREKIKNSVNNERVDSIGMFEDTEDIKLVYEESNIDSSKIGNKETPKIVELSAVRTPRRVQLITLSSPKQSKK